MKTLLLAAAVAASLCACADTSTSTSTGVGATGAIAMEPAPMAAAQSATAYLTMAASGDMFEIRSSQLALQRSQNPQLRAYAQQLIDDHTRLSSATMAAAAQGGVTPPSPAMVAKHADMLNMLTGTAADQFDAAYMRMQMDAHNEAIALHRGYASAGDNAALRANAAAAVPVVESHLRMLQGGPMR